MARITRPKNNQVFQIHSILSAVLGLLIFIFPHSCGVFFLEGSTKNGIESETGHLLIRMYGILMYFILVRWEGLWRSGKIQVSRDVLSHFLPSHILFRPLK